MARARQEVEWDKIAWLCAHIPRFGKSGKGFEDFHPMKRQEKAQREKELHGYFQELRDTLPPDKGPEDVEARWKRHVDGESK